MALQESSERAEYVDSGLFLSTQKQALWSSMGLSLGRSAQDCSIKVFLSHLLPPPPGLGRHLKQLAVEPNKST